MSCLLSDTHRVTALQTNPLGPYLSDWCEVSPTPGTVSDRCYVEQAPKRDHIQRLREQDWAFTAVNPHNTRLLTRLLNPAVHVSKFIALIRLGMSICKQDVNRRSRCPHEGSGFAHAASSLNSLQTSSRPLGLQPRWEGWKHPQVHHHCSQPELSRLVQLPSLHLDSPCCSPDSEGRACC